MKRLALAVVGLALSVTGSGCCGCLHNMFHGGYGGNCNPCGSPCGQMAPMGGCPGGACGYGPGAFAAPVGTTAMMQPYGNNAPMFAAVANNPTY